MSTPLIEGSRVFAYQGQLALPECAKVTPTKILRSQPVLRRGINGMNSAEDVVNISIQVLKDRLSLIIATDIMPEPKSRQTFPLDTETKPYKYYLMSGTELAQHPEIITDIGAMLLSQPPERFHARFTKFKYTQSPAGTVVHPEKLRQRSESYLQAKINFTRDLLKELSSNITKKVVLVYDETGRLAVLADALQDETNSKWVVTDVIRAVEPRSSGITSLTDFALDTLYEGLLQDPKIDRISAYVHRDNIKSHAKFYARYEKLENKGFLVSMHDGKPIVNSKEDPISIPVYKTSPHWREYRLDKRPTPA